MTKRLHVGLTFLAMLSFVLGLAGEAQAVDGVILIDQNRALAGGVNSCDSPGFPVTICQPGSYRLSGNLTAPPGVTGVILTTDNVTLDLNGFTIAGQDLGTAGNQPFGVVVTSCDQPNFPEVTICHSGIVVRNGVVTGFFSGVDLLYTAGSIIGVHANRNTNIGLRIGSPGIVRESVSEHNGTGIIALTCPVLITNNSVANNNSNNIRVTPAAPNSCLVIQNAVP
jgi:hypothetical protein